MVWGGCPATGILTRCYPTIGSSVIVAIPRWVERHVVSRLRYHVPFIVFFFGSLGDEPEVDTIPFMYKWRYPYIAEFCVAKFFEHFLL